MFADNGGHMIGAQFNGPVELINYHAQHGPTNSNGEWWSMEQRWAARVATTSIEVNIKPKFASTTDKRPIYFEVQYWYGGTQQVVITPIVNQLPVPTSIVNTPTFIISNP